MRKQELQIQIYHPASNQVGVRTKFKYNISLATATNHAMNDADVQFIFFQKSKHILTDSIQRMQCWSSPGNTPTTIDKLQKMKRTQLT